MIHIKRLGVGLVQIGLIGGAIIDSSIRAAVIGIVIAGFAYVLGYLFIKAWLE